MFKASIRFFRGITSYQQSLLRQLNSGYKSQYSVENIYPKSCSDILSGAARAPAETAEGSSGAKDKKNETFSGYIPVDKLDIHYTKSSGPGGQHVNKVNTKVEVRFHVDSASWIPEWIRPKLKEKQKLKISKDGELIVASDKTRKQILNQADCMEKIREMIRSAAQRPKPTSEEDLELRKKRYQTRAREVLREKRLESQTKQSRQSPQIE